MQAALSWLCCEVAKMTYDDAGEQAALAQQQAMAQANPGHLSHRSHRSETSRTTSHAGSGSAMRAVRAQSLRSSAVPTQRPQGQTFLDLCAAL